MKNRDQFRKQATALVSQMTIEEAAGQLLHSAPAIERLNVPAYNWWNEALHGVARAGIATVFPQAIGMAATYDIDLIYEEGQIVSTEARAKYNAAIRYGDHDIYKGLTYWSPNINIFRDPRWGRGHETLGEDPVLTSILGNAYIKSLQGDGQHLKLSACAKHFAVHSGPEELRHSFNAVVTEKDLYETYLPAFESAVKDADVESVMGAYNAVWGEPCCANERLLQTILREEWGFEGHMVSDCWAVRDFHEHHHFTTCGAESASIAIRRGCDVNCGCTYERLLEGLSKGLITEEEIRESAIRAFTTRYALGMFSDDCEYDTIPYTAVNTKQNREMALKAAKESIVLLKNDGILPLDTKNTSLRNIAVIGPNADSKAALYGNYYGDSDHFVTNLEGIQKYVDQLNRDSATNEEYRVFYSQGCHLSVIQDDGLSKPMRLLSEVDAIIDCSEVVIVCLGLDEHLEGEEGDDGNQYSSGDKKDLLLPLPQRLLLDHILPCKKPVILVVNAGSSLDLSAYENQVSAILICWYSGEEGGTALSDTLFGQNNPSGKLPITFYYNNQLIPEFTDYHMKGRTYRYLLEKPWYPFGYGLSYTNFVYTDVKASVAREGGNRLLNAGIDEDRVLKLCCTISNEGNYDGAEIVEVYSRYENEAFEKPRYQLIGFDRRNISAGRNALVVLNIPLKRICVYDEEGKASIPEGKYTIYIGGSLPDEHSTSLLGQTPVAISCVMDKGVFRIL